MPRRSNTPRGSSHRKTMGHRMHKRSRDVRTAPRRSRKHWQPTWYTHEELEQRYMDELERLRIQADKERLNS